MAIKKNCLFYSSNLNEECRILNKLYCKECNNPCRFYKSKKEWKRNEIVEIERRYPNMVAYRGEKKRKINTI